MRAKPSPIQRVPLKSASPIRHERRGKGLGFEKIPEKNSESRGGVRVKRRAGALRYRLRRSRRALRFLLPILRRRRGLDIRGSPFQYLNLPLRTFLRAA